MQTGDWYEGESMLHRPWKEDFSLWRQPESDTRYTWLKFRSDTRYIWFHLIVTKNVIVGWQTNVFNDVLIVMADLINLSFYKIAQSLVFMIYLQDKLDKSLAYKMAQN